MSDKPATAPPAKEELKGQSTHIDYHRGMYADPNGHTPGKYSLPDHIREQYTGLPYVGYKELVADEKVTPALQEE